MTTQEILQRLHGVKQINGGWQCKCPAHTDENPSLSVSEGTDGRILMTCHAGCKIEQIVSAMGLQMTDLFPLKEKSKITDIYDYTNAEGKLIYQVCRFYPKDFRCRKPNGNGGFDWNMKGIERVLYNLPKLIIAKENNEMIFVAEGEKDANAFSRFELFATCNPGGANVWTQKFAETLYGCNIVVVSHKDKAGCDHAHSVAKSLYGKVKSLCVIEMPDRENNNVNDFCDWVQAGGTIEELREIFSKTPDWTPPIAKSKENKKPQTDEHLNYDLEFVENDKGKIKPVSVPIPWNQVMDRIIAKTQGNLARVDNLMFAKPPEPGGEIHYLENHAAFFGILGVSNRTTIDWTNVQKSMKREEAFSTIKLRLNKYRGIETAPHHPVMPNLYYNHPILPEPDNQAVSDLLDCFCPETSEDRAFILSMFLTALWGGGEGQRPAFVVASKDGRGSGKSTVGEMIAAVLGQPFISGGTKQSIEDLKTRILSPEGLTSRVVIFDNETGRVSCGELAGLITSPLISGRRLYEGEGRRPNNLLWIITLNTPSLDSDLASRSIPVSVKKPTYSPDWKTETLALVESHRWGIISALIAMLKTDTPRLDTVTRWGAWENEVLSKIGSFCPDIPKLQSIILDRQRAFDDEADEIQLIRDGFIEAIKLADVDAEMFPCFFKNSHASDIYNSVTGARVRKNTALRDIKNLIRMGAISELKEHQHGVYGRGFLWVSDTAVAGDHQIKLITRPEPSDFNTH